MKFKIINANFIESLGITFPETVDMRLMCVITEISEDGGWLIVVLFSPVGNYLLRVFSVGSDKLATLRYEKEGAQAYVYARRRGYAVVRYITANGTEPDDTTNWSDWFSDSDTNMSGGELFIENLSQQIITIFMASESPNEQEIHRFPSRVDSTVPMPVLLKFTIDGVNKKITKKEGSYARIKRPIKTGDLIFCDDETPIYASIWIVGKKDDQLLPYPLDPTFSIEDWLKTPLTEKRKGAEHCFENGFYKITGVFRVQE